MMAPEFRKLRRSCGTLALGRGELDLCLGSKRPVVECSRSQTVKTQARCPWLSLNLGFLLCKNRNNSARGLS